MICFPCIVLNKYEEKGCLVEYSVFSKKQLKMDSNLYA